jgi:hypothetical protein
LGRGGVDFINIFGEKQMAKSTKSPANCGKVRTLCRKSLKLFLHMATSEKLLFVVHAKKPRVNMLMILMLGEPLTLLVAYLQHFIFFATYQWSQ